MYLAPRARLGVEPEPEPRPSGSQIRALQAPCTPASPGQRAALGVSLGQRLGSRLVAG